MRDIPHILLLFSLFVIPSLLSPIVGLAIYIVPLAITVFIDKFGWSYTTRQLLIALPLSLLFSNAVLHLETTLLIAAFIPSGYILAHSIEVQDQPWKTGAKCIGILLLSQLLLLNYLFEGKEVSHFELVAAFFINNIDGLIEIYRRSSNISPKEFAAAEHMLIQIRSTIPIIVPTIIGISLSIWALILILLGKLILPKFGSAVPWPKFRLWKLPDEMIWAVIVAGILIILPGSKLSHISLNALLICLFIYSLQGLAILNFFLNKWKLPKLIRFLIYLVALQQVFGHFLFIITGVADTWLDLRKINPSQKNAENSPSN